MAISGAVTEQAATEDHPEALEDSSERSILFGTKDKDEQNPSTVAGALRLRERQQSQPA